ncbi:hypothetical protein ACHAWC_005017 [Mediolabrus comicus]
MKSYGLLLSSSAAILAASSVSAFTSSTVNVGARGVPLMAAKEATAEPSVNAAIKVAANGMSLLKPIFAAEANLQAAVLGALAKVDVDAVKSTIDAEKKENKVLIYTYGLSPFSTEAIAILEESGYPYKNIELGAEWFLLGGEASQTRVELAKAVESGATSLPKIFIGGACIGGYAELADIVAEGKLDETMKKAKVTKKGGGANKPNFLSMFS